MKYPVHDITPTYLTLGILSTLREVDHQATEVLRKHGMSNVITLIVIVILFLHCVLLVCPQERCLS